MLKSLVHVENEPQKSAIWGRANNRGSLGYSVLSASLVCVTPLLGIIFSIIIIDFQGSIADFVYAAYSGNLSSILPAYYFRFSWHALAGYAFWVFLQALLFWGLPAKKSLGQPTAGGNILSYKTNGLSAWFVTHAILGLLCWLGVVDPGFVPKNWIRLWHVANIFGFLVSGFAFIKGHLAPSHIADRKFTGSLLYDFYMGIEHNPRIGNDFDIKLFTIGRLGMISWTVIDISNIAYQYQTYRIITPSLVLVTILHGIYVVDFFVHEDWYLRTIDIAHNHFGFYLAWGSIVWIPATYTLQAQYLGYFPTVVSRIYLIIVFGLGLAGYIVFRVANNQKDRVRSSNGNCLVFGQPPQYIRARYKTADGKMHESILLCSGWWGWSRHANYVGDLLMSFAMCALVGTTRLLVWFYGFFMLGLLIHRCLRDEKRCHDKYGKYWQDYCRQVRWRLIPGVW
ncbi:Ergosterol biosynthesis ERG4 ERG24 family [Pyrenophora seminiperda CCB06]|uniref:7-dehydrocholesterol reductase n=1 Tax=Pyrenophora seminiperda CCB06 TaxID=1302712 RepID=A0A3M7M3W5_9PLEO|nr:Ergosterol biosynthesis ERG4 ERG24 family [Pyrenophora seminiperda CCB06]